MNKTWGILIVLALFFVISMCGTVWAEDTSNFDSVTSDAATFEAADSTISDSDTVSDASISDSGVAFETYDSTISTGSDFVTAPCPPNSDIGRADSGVNSEEPQAKQFQQPQSEAEITFTGSDNLREKIISDATLSGETGPKLPDPFNTRTGKGFTTIQAAIDDSDTSDGDIIEVEAGTYTENVVVNKSLTIRPVLEDSVTVQAADPSKPVFTITAAGSGSIIEGFNISGAASSCGIYLNSTNNCCIVGNKITSNGAGIEIRKSSGNIIDGNVITNNVNYGVNVFYSSANKISKNSINYNGNGIYLYTSSNNEINGNIITKNGIGKIYIFNNGIYIKGSSNNKVFGNIISCNHGAEIWLDGSHNNLINENTITDNGNSTDGDGIHLYRSSTNVISENNIMLNSWGINLDHLCKNNDIVGNTIKANKYYGIYCYNSSENKIINNTITENNDGIKLSQSHCSIVGNTISNNRNDGIYISTYLSGSVFNTNFSTTINFNRIVGNGGYGLRVYLSDKIINAENNWWGSNAPTVSSNKGSDIYLTGRTVKYDPWLVLKVNASPDKISGRESIITADLTYNNKGENTLPKGHVPDVF